MIETLAELYGLPLASVAGLVAVSFTAAMIDAVAGGGGLLNVPALMLAGLNPVAAVATNKLQGTAGAISATRSYMRAGLIDRVAMRGAFLASLAGGAMGAVSAQIVPIDALRTGVPVLLIGVALFVAASPKLSDVASRARLGLMPYALGVALVIGFYDGIFGPGGGTFYFISLVLLLGQGVTRAAGNAKFLNLASNAGALGLFAFSGQVWWALGLTLGLASMLGARIGARAALKRGAGLIKPLVVIVSILMALRLLADPTHPIGQWLRS
ncbi:MAG TPA: TSUP family transporter [Beijerinckiaceae bacterium]|nr:TSUP family transporter [Beijerinckiaceae bacterium]